MDVGQQAKQPVPNKPFVPMAGIGMMGGNTGQ